MCVLYVKVQLRYGVRRSETYIACAHTPVANHNSQHSVILVADWKCMSPNGIKKWMKQLTSRTAKTLLQTTSLCHQVQVQGIKSCLSSFMPTPKSALRLPHEFWWLALQQANSDTYNNCKNYVVLHRLKTIIYPSIWPAFVIRNKHHKSSLSASALQFCTESAHDEQHAKPKLYSVHWTGYRLIIEDLQHEHVTMDSKI